MAALLSPRWGQTGSADEGVNYHEQEHIGDHANYDRFYHDYSEVMGAIAPMMPPPLPD